jgi:flagellar motor switch protein FliN/FliY
MAEETDLPGLGPEEEGALGVAGDEAVRPAAPHAEPAAVQAVEFMPLNGQSRGDQSHTMDLLMDVPLNVTVELGRTTMQIRDLLQVGPGSVVELEKLAGEPVDVLANSKLIARGEVVVIDENFGVRITQIVSQAERMASV